LPEPDELNAHAESASRAPPCQRSCATAATAPTAYPWTLVKRRTAHRPAAPLPPAATRCHRCPPLTRTAVDGGESQAQMFSRAPPLPPLALSRTRRHRHRHRTR
jgi:hypothetical protein